MVCNSVSTHIQLNTVYKDKLFHGQTNEIYCSLDIYTHYRFDACRRATVCQLIRVVCRLVQVMFLQLGYEADPL